MRRSAEEIKKEIAYKAESLFSQKGYAATSMEEICEITERSKGSIYYHFKSKEELFLFVVKQHTYDWLEKWNEKRSCIVRILKTIWSRRISCRGHTATNFKCNRGILYEPSCK